MDGILVTSEARDRTSESNGIAKFCVDGRQMIASFSAWKPENPSADDRVVEIEGTVSAVRQLHDLPGHGN